jgi:hypothetical protein
VRSGRAIWRSCEGSLDIARVHQSASSSQRDPAPVVENRLNGADAHLLDRFAAGGAKANAIGAGLFGML